MFLGLAAVAVLLVLGRVFATFPGDEWVLLELRELRAGWLTGGAVVASSIGMAGVFWAIPVPWIPVAVVAGALVLRRRADAVFMAVATLAPLINLGLKELVARPRPDPSLALITESGYAYPSGHAVFAAAFYGALILVACRSRYLSTRRGLRWAVRVVLLALILAVGFSRVYLGVHWPSDVIAGFVVGAVCLTALDTVRNLDRTRRGP